MFPAGLRAYHVLCFAASLTLILWGTATPARADNPDCPGARTGQSVPFDDTTVVFDSVPSSLNEKATQITYCVRFAGVPHEYFIDWNDVGLKDVFTRNGFLSSSLTIAGLPIIGSSTAYVGVNRVPFALGILREQTLKDSAAELFQNVLNWVSSRFHGSISTVVSTRPEAERREKLQPVDLEFTAEKTNAGEVTFRFVDHAKDRKARIEFEPPEEIRQRNDDIPKGVTITQEEGALHYKVDPATAIHKRVAVTLHNSDYQKIAVIPVVLFIDGGR
jgi:hypothetical protein